MRPIIGFAYQSGPHGVLQNVIGFLAFGFPGAEAVVEEVTLPGKAAFGGGPAFPIGDRAAQRTFDRHTKNCMNMIGHHKKKPRVPNSLFVAMTHGFEEDFWNARTGEENGRAFRHANGDKEKLAAGADAGRRIMRKGLPANGVHEAGFYGHLIEMSLPKKAGIAFLSSGPILPGLASVGKRGT